MPITLPSFVAPNELIQSAWGNAVVDALDELDDEKLNLTGGTITGNLGVEGLMSTLEGLALPVGQPSDAGRAARKDYVDTADALRLLLTGGTVTGQILVNRAGIDHCVLIEQDPAGGNGAVLRADGQLQTSITGSAGSTISTPNIIIGRGGTPANDTGVYVEFRSNPSSSLDPQGTLRGSITVNGGGGGAVAYNTSSDKRLKTDVGLVSGDGLGTIDRIIVRRYMRDDAESVGVFAQELADVVPQAVTAGGDDPLTEPWQVAYSNENIVGHLTLAVQQLAARVTELEDV